MSGHDEYHHDEHNHHHHHDDHHHHHGDDHNLITSSTNNDDGSATRTSEGHTDESHDFVQPSAPTIENGYIVVPPTPQSSVDASSAETIGKHDLFGKQDAIVEELTKVVNEVNKELPQQVTNTVFAEADSSNEPAASAAAPKPKPAESGDKKKKVEATEGCSLCPYYLLAVDRLSKVEVPPKVKDLLLWKDVKLTGAVFGSSLVLLISLAAFSLLTVISTLFLTALVALGAYRFYLGLIFRIKGNYDNTFDKLSSHDLSLPKDKIKQLVHLLETDVNRTLNALKSIVLWDNLVTSLLAFGGFYMMYCVGSMFNTITLLILGLVSAFTLPKVYTVYKVQIDQAIEKTTSAVHQVVKQVLVKIPMLNKKKTQ